MPRKHTLHEIRDTAGRIFEVYCPPNEKEAWRLARHRIWATSNSHVGIRRILRTISGERWPVLEEEAIYITALRDGAEKKRASEELKRQAAAGAPERIAKRKAAEDAAYVLRVEQMCIEREIRRKKLEALDARLGRHRLLPNLPTYDPFTNEWV